MPPIELLSQVLPVGGTLLVIAAAAYYGYEILGWGAQVAAGVKIVIGMLVTLAIGLALGVITIDLSRLTELGQVAFSAAKGVLG